MLLTEFAKIKINWKNIQHYKDKGYNCNIGDVIKVKAMDLSPCSKYIVKYKCDECGKEFETQFIHYYEKKQRKVSSLGDFCTHCIGKKMKEWYEKNEPGKWEEDYKNRTKKTKETLLKKYGVDNAVKIEGVIEKIKKTNMERYGAEHPMQVPEFRKKQYEALSNHREITYIIGPNGDKRYMYKGMPFSKNQKYICDLYNGKLNEYIDGMYCVDILLDDNIYFEYDGTGHKMEIIMGRKTEEEFKKKEIKRYKSLKYKGYKQIKFISLKKNSLPSDGTLLKIKEIAIEYLSQPDHNWINFDYDNGTIKTKEGEESFNFD